MELCKIQNELKAPKNQFNKFGGYKYRSCEDILEAVKPILAKHGCTLTLNDEVVFIGSRYYVKATCTLRDKDEVVTTQAFAREEEVKKGMDASQITGASSSYARKYALNAMFLIDDTKDADTDAYTQQQKKAAPTQPKIEAAVAPDIVQGIIARASIAGSKNELIDLYKECVNENKWNNEIAAAFSQIKKDRGWN